MNRNEFMESFWRYYQSLENDFEHTTRYVSLNEKNFNTFSIEYARLLQAICSEIEIVLKQICEIDDEKYYNIGDLAKKILGIDEKFLEHTIYLQKYSHDHIKPFKDDTNEHGVPFWWLAYDKIKHNRKLEMEESNLKCVLYALAGLYFCEDYLLAKIAKEMNDVDIMDEPSSLFASDIHKKHMLINKNLVAEVYEENGKIYIN